MSSRIDQFVTKLRDNNDDKRSISFPRTSTILDNHQLPSLQCSFKTSSERNLHVKAKVQSRFPRLNVKKHSIHIPYKIDHGFTLNEKRIIKNALKVVADCFMNPENLKNMYHICGTSGYLLGKYVWERSLLETHQCHHDYSYLIRYQLMCLKVKSDTNQFPIINIHPIYEKSNVLGKGTLGCMSCNSLGPKVLINDEFHVYLNRYYLGARGRDGTNAIFWGGVIVHEMLHNLGHKHEKNDTSNRWQINAFEQSFVHTARYLP